MKKIFKMILIGIKTIILFIIIGGSTSGITKTIYSDVLIEQFKNKAKLDENESTNKVKIYKVPSLETRPTYKKIGTEYFPGNQADILITLRSDLNIPVVQDFISFFAGGHAGLVLGEYKDLVHSITSENTIECSLFNEKLNLANLFFLDYWKNYRYPIIALRVNLTEKEIDRIISRGISLIGDPYNKSFLFDTKNKSYCSDLIGKAYSSIGINLNKDGFTTSIYDLLISNKTYISYYRYFDKEGIEYIYCLETK